MIKVKKIFLAFALICACVLSGLITHVDAFALEEVTGIATVKDDLKSLNVRSGPGKDYDAMGKVYPGNTVNVTGVDGDWLRIEYQNSQGYVSAEYVDFEPDEVEEIVEEDTPAVDAFDEDEVTDEPTFDYKIIMGLVGGIVVLLIIILLTVKSIKNMDENDDEEDEDEDEDDDYDEDDYDDDEYEDDDEDEDEDDEYEYVMVRRPKQTAKTSSKSSDDYSLNIDPRYFD